MSNALRMFIFFMVTAIIRLSRQRFLTTTKTVFLQATRSRSHQSITNLDICNLYATLNLNKMQSSQCVNETLQSDIFLIYHGY